MLFCGDNVIVDKQQEEVVGWNWWTPWLSDDLFSNINNST